METQRQNGGTKAPGRCRVFAPHPPGRWRFAPTRGGPGAASHKEHHWNTDFVTDGTEDVFET